MLDVEVEPDPARPLGGYARIILPAGTVDATELSVTVFEMFKERYLGENGWYPTEVAFGPYPVESSMTHQQITIGPEIVNNLSEFVPVRLGFGSFDAEITWPDTVAIAPNAPPIGGVIGHGTQPVNLSAAVDKPLGEQTAPTPPDPTPDPEPVPDPTPEPQPETGNGDDEKGGRSWIVLTIFALLVLAIAVAGYFYLQEDSPPIEPEPEPTPVIEEAEETAEIDPCAPEILTASEDLFATQLENLRGCAAATDAETALQVLEEGIDSDDPQALLLFGHLYNPDVTDDDIEGAMGLSFSDNLEVAIDYYTRARTAGSTDAEGALAQACESLTAFDPTVAEEICE